ncbi:MAG: flagellar hook-associated protein FlgK, partial [Proteobacteria bacterium]|nr:flagellar hook-associated protein FlgK [Pseudomonadota bacterium]
MSGLINIAITGLKLSQLALSITGQNIVNANTEGYSRQSISTVTTDPLLGAAGYVGTGVSVTSIFRNTQAYLVDQVTSDIAVFEEFNLFLNNINQVDALLADPSTSLSAGIDGFFRALNESANDPASLVGRQLLLAETKLLVNNFKTMESKLLFQNHALNRQFDALATNVATIAEEIAELNAAIANSRGVNSGKLPNDLLDRRDILVNELAELVSVTVIRHSNETIDVFIGQGQGLVIGPQPRKMISLPGALEPDRRELAFDVNGNAEVITKQLTGGQIGALIRFRSEALEPALNALGRIALAISSGLNDLQKLGIDLEGSLGVPMFTDINDPVLAFNRVRSDSNNL